MITSIRLVTILIRPAKRSFDVICSRRYAHSTYNCNFFLLFSQPRDRLYSTPFRYCLRASNVSQSESIKKIVKMSNTECGHLWASWEENFIARATFRKLRDRKKRSSPCFQRSAFNSDLHNESRWFLLIYYFAVLQDYE